jgi:uncharacterized phage infection (PIP) family protein YhgE
MNQSSSPITGERLLGAAKKNPEGLLLLAAGACLLLRNSGTSAGLQRGQAPRSSERSTLGNAANSAREFANDATNRAKDAVDAVTERTKGAADAVTSSASEYASETARTIGEQSERMARQAQSTLRSTVNRILKEQPLAIAAAGIAAGAVVAAAFPATEFEREHLGPYGDQLSDAAQRVGGQFKEATAKAGETLKTAAEDRGLTTEGLKEVASEVADAFGDSMKGKAGSQDTGVGPGGARGSNHAR